MYTCDAHLAFVFLLPATYLDAAEGRRRRHLVCGRLEANGLEEAARYLDARDGDDERRHDVHAEEEDDEKPLAERARLHQPVPRPYPAAHYGVYVVEAILATHNHTMVYYYWGVGLAKNAILLSQMLY